MRDFKALGAKPLARESQGFSKVLWLIAAERLQAAGDTTTETQPLRDPGFAALWPLRPTLRAADPQLQREPQASLTRKVPST